MGKRATPLEIYKLLDKSNCTKCGKESCLEFATDLLERRISLDECSHLKRPTQNQNYYKIKSLIQPPQREITFGISPRMCTIGGEEILYRHERTFYNQTALAVEIHDCLENFESIVTYLTNLTISRIGEDLRLDAIAIRCVSQDSEKYLACVTKVSQISDLPIILCCLDPKIIKKAATKIESYRPLLYAATLNTAESFAKIARDLKLPLVCHADNLDDLHRLVVSLAEFGVQNLILDPGTYLGKGLTGLTFNHIQQIRHQLFQDDLKAWGSPILGVPAAYWSQISSNSNSKQIPEIENMWRKQYEEILMGIILETIDTNLLILHTGRTEEEIWGLLALMTYRQNIFTDPRVYPRVDPGLVIIGKPTEWSPIYVTSNYRMTKIPVEQDLIDANLNGYLIVVDTDGIGIESATAGGQFNEERIKKAFDSTKIFEKVKHRIVILPGMAARLKSPLEELGKVDVWIGPRDSSGIASFIQEQWKDDEIKEKFLST